MSDFNKLSRQEWVTRCAQEIDVLVPQSQVEHFEDLSLAFVKDWAAAVWMDCQGSDQPELAAWAAVKDAKRVWSLVAAKASGELAQKHI